MAGKRSIEKRRRDREAGNVPVDINAARQERKEKREEELRRQQEKSEKAGAKRSPRSAKRRLIFCAVFVLVAALVISSVYNLVKLKVEQDRVAGELEALRQEKAELEAELLRVDDPDYIEQQARELLHMIYPGEVLYLIKESEKDAGEETEAPADGDGAGEEPAEGN